MKEKYIKITTTNKVDVLEIDSDELLKGFYSAIDCSSVALISVRIFPHKPPYLLVVDEEGKVKDPPKQPNEVATMLFKGAVIVGDVIIGKSGLRNGEPDIVGLDSYEVESLLFHLTWVTGYVV